MDSDLPDTQPAAKGASPMHDGSRGVTVVFMPTWKCRAWLPEAIESVCGQTLAHVDLYVADDGGDDLDDELVESYPDVTFLKLARRGGPYRIANLLLQLTRSEFVAFHDADDWSHPCRLELQIRYLEERALDGCGSWYRMLDVHGDPIGFATPPEAASSALRAVLGDQLLHPTSVFRRKIFERLGGFDARTRFSGDTEFHYRACLSEHLGNLQRFLYHRRVHPGSLTQHPATAIGSPARDAYLGEVRRTAALAIERGAPPPPGHVLLGYPVLMPSLDEVEWIRVGRTNQSVRDDLELPPDRGTAQPRR